MTGDRGDGDDDLSVPAVSVPEGWVRTDVSTERVFSLSKVTVEAATVVYEDRELRERVRSVLNSDGDDDVEGSDTDGDDDDVFRRFFFASRLRLRPKTKASSALTTLVTSRAKDGFANRLEGRGIVGISERERRRFRVGETEATLVGYDASCTLDGASLAVDGWVAVWPDDDVRGDYFVAGGAYPTRVESGPAELGELLDPSRFRNDLLALIRSVP